MDIFAEIEYEPAVSFETGVNPPVHSRASQQVKIGDADPVRQKFYDMRGMASDNPYMWNDARLFYKQAKFMENFVDDFENYTEFSMHSPCFQRMGYERLRTYFTWRTAARQGEFLPICLSYIFLYIYELLACVGEETPQHALNQLLALQNAYAEKFPALNNYLPAWFQDFYIYYDMPTGFAEFAEKNNLYEFYSEIFAFETTAETYGRTLSAWNKFSAYDIKKSKFFTASEENAKLFQNCFAAVFCALSTLCETKNFHIKDLFIRTSTEEIPWVPFRRAIFHPWLKQPDRTIEILPGETFRRTNNNITTLYAAPYSHRKELMGFIIKKTEAVVRACSGFKPKITADPSALIKARTVLNEIVTIPEIETTIETAVAEFFKEKNRIIVTVSRKNIERIREEAEDITEKLAVEDETLEPPQAVKPQYIPKESAEENIRVNIWVNFANSLTAPEKTALQQPSNAKQVADSAGIMLEILADSINEKAMDTIGDSILEISADSGFEIYDDYKNFVFSSLA